MKLPEIGDLITTESAIALCGHFGLDYLIARITANPAHYKAWPFDGCSCLPDKFVGFVSLCDWRAITYQCCLPHDLGYAYGDKGNAAERARVDRKFYNDLVAKAGMQKWMASFFLAGVKMGGREELGLPFSWGFARRQRSQ